MQMHVSSIFWLIPKSFGHSSNREFLSRDTSIHMFSKPSCCTNYNTSSNAEFEEVTVLITFWIVVNIPLTQALIHIVVNLLNLSETFFVTNHLDVLFDVLIYS